MIGLFATTCPFPISGISPSETGEFCFRFRVLLFYATQEAFQELQRMIAASGLLVFVKDNRMVSIILTGPVDPHVTFGSCFRSCPISPEKAARIHPDLPAHTPTHRGSAGPVG